MTKMPAAIPPQAGATFRICFVSWQSHASALQAVRREVFIEGQGISEDEEWDDRDDECRHALAEDAGGAPIGTARLFPSGRIGRLAVVSAWRGRGVGAALLEFVLADAVANGCPDIRLDAQCQAIPFYVKAGFVPMGEEFLDAGIPHREMIYSPKHEKSSV